MTKTRFLNLSPDGIWQFIGVIVALVTLAWAYSAFILGKPIYEIQATLLTNTSLAMLTGEFKEDLKITYAGQEAKNVSLVDIKLENTGDQPIPSASFEKPIRFLFPEGTTVLKALSIESIPENLGIQITPLKNEAVISPTLLNASDRVVIRLIVADIPPDSTDIPFTINARILNVKSIPIASVLEQSQIKSNVATNLLT